ncbi:arogenate dehydratase/prephenate dehydratase 2, chloroplastic-like [Gossypium arboreum]|uniref:arogenate dehydratase/prephenate dehydratase 2, chloroplastic-like n=1 Tax=Gossypium arboreum TaxID=29729 RepID=UPI0022F146A9|nr:arogenate dehydratase/prephenate dehydratase 2, chloroplastic-like [Gossypium arboreum]
MALFSGCHLFVLSNYRQTNSFKPPHSHLYSKHLRSLNLDFAFHQKARNSNTIESGNTKNCAAPVANMNGFQPRCHLQYDLAHDTGIRGAYSESAAEKAYPNCETIACQHFHSTFQAVARRVADRAVIPIENSLGGSIHGNYDLLHRHNLHIIGEIQFAVSHCLLANNGVDLHDLKTVLSHPQALAQCEKSLTKLGLEGEAVANTAVAAKVKGLNDEPHYS